MAKGEPKGQSRRNFLRYLLGLPVLAACSQVPVDPNARGPPADINHLKGYATRGGYSFSEHIGDSVITTHYVNESETLLDINGQEQLMHPGEAFLAENGILAILQEIVYNEAQNADGNQTGWMAVYRIATGGYYDAKDMDVGNSAEFRFRQEGDDETKVAATLEHVVRNKAIVNVAGQPFVLKAGKPEVVTGIKTYDTLDLYVANLENDKAQVILVEPIQQIY